MSLSFSPIPENDVGEMKPLERSKPPERILFDPSIPSEIRRLSNRSASARSASSLNFWNPPPNEDEEPLRVDFRCACFKLNNVSTVSFSVMIKFVIVFEWNDERLIDHEDILTTNDLPGDLWGPDIILENAQNDCEVVYDSFSLLDSGTGRLKRTVTFHGDVYNPMDLEDFPFDWDDLEMKFISLCNWRTLDGSRFGNDVCNRTYTLHAMLRRKDVQFFTLGWGGKIPEFQILGWAQKVTIPDDSALPMCFKFDIHLFRKEAFYYLKVMLPLWLLVITSVAAYGIEPEELASRLEVLVTLLLSTIAFLYIVQESIPKINHLTVIDKVVILSLVTLVLSVLFSFILSRLSEAEAGRLNIVFALVYLSFYVLMNFIVIGPPHYRHMRLRSKMIEKQQQGDDSAAEESSQLLQSSLSRRLPSKAKSARSLRTGRNSLAKSYNLSGGVLDLRGDKNQDSRGDMLNIEE